MKQIIAALSLLLTACAQSPVEQASSPRPIFKCSGSKPFWRMEINGEWATVTTPHGEGTAVADYFGHWVDSAPGNGVFQWQGEQDLLLVIDQQACVSAADEEFDYTTNLQILFPQSYVAPGCCRRVD